MYFTTEKFEHSAAQMQKWHLLSMFFLAFATSLRENFPLALLYLTIPHFADLLNVHITLMMFDHLQLRPFQNTL